MINSLMRAQAMSAVERDRPGGAEFRSDAPGMMRLANQRTVGARGRENAGEVLQAG